MSEPPDAVHVAEEAPSPAWRDASSFRGASKTRFASPRTDIDPTTIDAGYRW